MLVHALCALALLVSLRVSALPAEPPPWERFTPDQVVCDHDPGAERQRFWEVADWGVVPATRDRLVEYCSGEGATPAASMRCTPDHRTCHARGVRITVPPAGSGPTAPVGVAASARCLLSQDYPRAETFGGISDWGPELSAFAGSEQSQACDVVVEAPTLFLKPDSRANIYHGLCDHVNLFLSLWIAGWESSADLRLVTWEPRTAAARVVSPWYELFDAFTTQPVQPLGFWAGKSVCFRDAVFAVNPRAPGTFYYNMPVPGREASCRSAPGGFLRSFAERTKERVLPRPPRRPGPGDPVRVKILSRSMGTGTTSGTRQMTNEAALVAAVRQRVGGIEVELVNFDWNGRPPIAGQLALMAETDVLVGMHGAGLVHALWLPPWAALYEVYNCGDLNTYRDLARLAGLAYFTGPEAAAVRRAPAVPVAAVHQANPKFWNYEIDEASFVATVEEAVRRVRAHPASPFGKKPIAAIPKP